jgi:hypothetical protein
VKHRPLTRRDFLKLAAVGTAVTLPTALGVGVYHSALGEYPLERSPYIETVHTAKLDGSVPILLIANKDSANPFGPYLGEILQAEGLNCFHTADLSDIQGESLGKYDIVILAESPLNTAQSETFEDYVARGGRLVGMKADDALGAVFGLAKAEGSLAEGYIKTAAGHPGTAGINSSTLQFHGEANQCELSGAQAIAWLYSDRDTRSAYPAIAISAFGKGLAVSFAFDLAKSIAYTRQGNLQLIDQDNDGLPGVRTVDKFVGWIDLERIHIPQADEQQRLFANILSLLSRQPLPRLWYFPQDIKCVLVATGDSHMNPATFIEDVLTRVEARGGHMTIYYAPQIVDDLGRAERRVRFWLTEHVPLLSDTLGQEYGSPTPRMVDDWRARGHEIALHPYVDDGLEGGWMKSWKEFTGRGYAPVPPTVRTHRILWTGWTETARVQASYGMRMNFDYYHVGPSLQKKDGEWAYGHITGSGRPMKFIDEQGRILNLYQQLTQITDEHLIPMDVPGWGGWPGLSAKQAVDVAKNLLDRSAKSGDYCAIGGQFHVDPFQMGGDPAKKAGIFLEGTLDYARELGVPIWSAQEWQHFSDLRHESGFGELAWDANTSTLTFRLAQKASLRLPAASPLESTLTVLLPLHHAHANLSTLCVDGTRLPLTSSLVLGNGEFALVTVSPGEHTFRASYS